MQQPSRVAEIRLSYAAVATLYTRMFGSVDQVHPTDLDLLRRRLTCGPIIDLGCGPGHLTAFLHGLGLEVHGVDLVPEFVAHARETYPGITFDVGSLTGLNCATGTLGGVLSWYSLIHTEPDELDTTLSEFRRVLRPGGIVIVGFFTGDAVEPFAHKVTKAYRWPIDSLAQRLSSAGFVEVERLHRPADGTDRAHGAIVAEATPAAAPSAP